MLKKTHIALGVASSLIITRPMSVTGIIACIVAGGLGGWIVDVDTKDLDINENKAENIIIDLMFIAAFIVFDFFIGHGMCSYVIDNWSVPVWGALLVMIILILIGINTSHRTFTHSLFCMSLFSAAMYFFCRPAVIPFAIGYASHLIADLFNHKGLRLLYPLKWELCFKKCYSDKRENKLLFWICFTIDVVLCSYLFSLSVLVNSGETEFLMYLNKTIFLGFNRISLYLLFINSLAFVWCLIVLKISNDQDSNVIEKYELRVARGIDDGFLYSFAMHLSDKIRYWIINALVFIGGGVGLLLSLALHRKYPTFSNGNLWSICYTGILFWLTVFCIVSNPFNLRINEIDWNFNLHLSVIVYLVCINIISALVFYTIRKKDFDKNSLKHTALIAIGFLGGTIGAIPVVFFNQTEKKYRYVTIGFNLMMIGQIVFIGYLLMTGIL